MKLWDDSLPDLLAIAQQWTPLQHLPPDNFIAMAHAVFEESRRFGLRVGFDLMTQQAAYEDARSWCWWLQVRTKGRYRWKASGFRCKWEIDTFSDAIVNRMGVENGKSYRALKQIAIGAIGDGSGDAVVRSKMKQAALQMAYPPPVETLFEAYHAAIREIKGNQKWMAQRKARA